MWCVFLWLVPRLQRAPGTKQTLPGQFLRESPWILEPAWVPQGQTGSVFAKGVAWFTGSGQRARPESAWTRFSLRKVLPLKDRQRTKVQGRVGKSCIRRHRERERETFQGTQNSASGALGPEQGFLQPRVFFFCSFFFFLFFFSSFFFSIFFFFFFLLSFLFLLFREASYRRQISWR